MATIQRKIEGDPYLLAREIYNHRAGCKIFNDDYSRLTPTELQMITKLVPGGTIAGTPTPETLKSVSVDSTRLSQNDNEIQLVDSKQDTEVPVTSRTSRGRKRIHRTAYDRVKAYRERRKK